jgi:hypothetical protein
VPVPINRPMEVSILEAQQILTALNVPHGPNDGLYGPKTRGGWGTAADQSDLAPEFERVGPTIAKVWSFTWDGLKRRAASETGLVTGIP